MKAKLLGTACAIGLLAGAADASAQGFYIGGMAGGNWLNSLTDDEPFSTGDSFKLDFRGGTAGSVFLGLMLMPGVRVEGEFGFRNNRLEDTVSPEGTVSGRVKTFSVMANAWYDFPIGVFRPYIGGGVGVASVRANLSSTNCCSADVTGTDTVLAYQFGAGFGVPVTPTVTITLDYRLLGTGGINIAADSGSPFGVTGNPLNQSVMIGARFNLGK